MPDHPPIKPAQFKGNYHEYGLYLHNWYRKRHGAPPLSLAKWMNDSGDNYCYKLARNGGILIHSSGLGYGENLWGGPQAEAWLRHTWPQSSENYMHKCAVREACEAWYDEVKYYNYNNGGFSMQTGHFTAMVWKGSSELGIGVSWVGGTIIVAGCYKIHPNMSGHFGANVLRYRSVTDTDDEEESEEEIDQQKPDKSEEKDVQRETDEEKDVQKQTDEEKDVQKENDEEKDVQKETDEEEQGEGVPDENATVDEDEASPEVQLAFADAADSDGTIGWYELKDLLANNIDFPSDKVKCDKVLCRMLIKTATSRNDTLSERIPFLTYQNLVKHVRQCVEHFTEADKDGGGYLDPFEVRDALSGGHDISYQDVQGFMKAVGETNGKMMMHGYILSELLTSILSSSDLGIAEDDHPAIVVWMEKMVEFAKSSTPLGEWK